MNKYLIISIAIVAFILNACEDYSVDAPNINSVSIEEQFENEDGTVTMQFVFDCDARDDVVVWWGTSESDYYAYQDSITNVTSLESNVTKSYPDGESLQEPGNWNGTNIVEKTYPAAGIYNMVIIATNIGEFGDDIKQTIHEQQITIE